MPQQRAVLLLHGQAYAGPITTPNAISPPRMLGSATDGEHQAGPSTGVGVATDPEVADHEERGEQVEPLVLGAADALHELHPAAAQAEPYGVQAPALEALDRSGSSRTSAKASERLRRAARLVLLDQGQVGVLEARPADLEVVHVVAVLGEQLAHERRSRRRSRARSARRRASTSPRPRRRPAGPAPRRCRRRRCARPPGSATRSASFSASSRSWVVSRIVVLSRSASRCTRWWKSRRACGSKPAVGSSRKSSSGRPMMPIATSSRRRCPPERVRSCGRRVLVEADDVEQLVDVPGRSCVGRRVRRVVAAELGEQPARRPPRVVTPRLQHHAGARPPGLLGASRGPRRARRSRRPSGSGSPRGSRSWWSCRHRWGRAGRPPHRRGSSKSTPVSTSLSP